LAEDGEMTERLSALFCIGCGRIDVPEPCVGDCDERMVDLVLAKDHDEARAYVGKAVQHAALLRELLLQLVSKVPEPTPPRSNDWSETHRRLQEQARSVLRDGAARSLGGVDRITAWRCLTCGWTEAARECLGICVRNRVDFIAATEYDDVSARYDEANRQVSELAAVVRQVAWVTPRPGEEERTWQSLRSRAEAVLTL
jgi:hypothetical protein